MPVDLYMWDSQGGLVHHCPNCQKPLTTPQAKNRCLGDHVEWCKNYHTQLFKKGCSGQCAPCRASDEECNKRHREIAEKLHEIKQIRFDSSPAPASPLTPRTLNTLEQLTIGTDESPLSKRERKAVKKAKKVSAMAKGITGAEVQFVTNVLRSESTSQSESLLEDGDVKQNIFFHKGTSNMRQVRNTFVKQDQIGAIGAAKYHPDPQRVTGLLQLLNVAPISNTTTPQEKALIVVLRKKIEEDLVQLHHEEEGRRMRKAGFWRWANKKAYKRLMANGSFWGDKDGDLLRAMKEEVEVQTDSTATTDTEVTEADTEITVPDEVGDGERPSSSDSMAAQAEPVTPSTGQALKDLKEVDTDDGWTIVGKVTNTKVKSPVGKLKLVHNGGLDKLVQSPGPKSFPAGFQPWFGTI